MNLERILRLILSPHLSEKATIGVEKRGEYVFKVVSNATKPEVKVAVEHLFKTKVECVRILNVKSKPKRFGKMEGRSKSWKKAYVTLEKGNQIDFSGGKQ